MRPTISGAASAVARTCKPVVRRAWQHRLSRTAETIDQASLGRTSLVLAPHPDDETLGCGALIGQRVASGAAVYVVIAADGRHSHNRSHVIDEHQLAEIRADEARRACEILGLPPEHLIQFGLEDMHLLDSMDDLTERLASVLLDVQPDEVFVTHRRDWHPDHRALNWALRSTRAYRSGQLRTFEYPVWYWADGPWDGGPGRTTWERARGFVSQPLRSLSESAVAVPTDGYLETKRSALRAYRSQVENLTGEETWAIMDERFLSAFLRDSELFFPVDDLEPPRF